MKNLNRVVAVALAVSTVLAASAQRAVAQRSQRGQPTTPFSVEDFARLRALEGTWQGTATDESPVFERIRFSSDSTIDITYFADSPTGRETGTGRIYLSVGRIYHTLGAARWGATRVDATGIYFVPQINAHNTYSWTFDSPSAWTATSRTGMGGREQVTVYHFQRAR